MESQKHQLKDGQELLIREAVVEDAQALLDYVEAISGESDFLSFGPGEFELTVEEEEDYLRKCRASDTQLYIVGLVEGEIVGSLSFTAGRRPRLRHSGEFGVSVRKAYWGLGIGSHMLDELLEWAQGAGITKINLRVRTDNLRAIELYKRKGFVVEGTIRRAIVIEGQTFDHYWMGLEL